MPEELTQLKDQIIAGRKMIDHNKRVLYDLTAGVDFSVPKETAQALSEVFFEKDTQNCFYVDDDRLLDFRPKYSAVIKLLNTNNGEGKEILKYFSKEVRNNEVKKYFYWEIQNSSSLSTAPVFWAILFSVAEVAGNRTVYRVDLAKELMANVKIEYVNA